MHRTALRPSRPIRLLSAIGLVAASAVLAAPVEPASPEGHWQGAIEIPGAALEIEVDLASTERGWTGSISIPVQNARDLPLRAIEVTDGAVQFAIDGVPGEPTFDGRLSENGRTIEGTFSQGGQEFPFRLSGAAPVAERARRALAEIDSVVERAMHGFEVPGLAIGVVVDGEPILQRGYGVRHLDEEQPVTADTLFAIGSCTKAFTTFLLGTLVDDGLLQWDRPVVGYLPDFRLADESATDRITVRDLVTHRSGLPRHDFLWYNSPLSRADMVHRLRYLDPFADLRERYHYQNLMYVAAGYLAEQVTGESWEELVGRRILEPLGMERSNFSVDRSQRDADHATPHGERDDRLQPIPFRDISAVGPAGSINSTVSEISRWLAMLLDEGRWDDTELIDSTTVREVFTPQTVMTGYPTEPAELLTSYGLGWALSAYRGRYRAAHGGGIDGFVAMTTVLPLDGIGVVVLSNRDGQGAPELITRHVLDRLLELDERDWIAEGLERKVRAEAAEQEVEENEELTRKEGTRPSHPLADYAGTYRDPGYGDIVVELDGDRLAATYNRISSPLEHWHYDVFNAVGGAGDPALEDTKVLFRSDLAGEISSLVVTMDPAVEPVVFEKQPDPRLFDPAYLERFVGAYRLPNQRLEIVLKGDTLHAVLPGQPTYELAPRRGTEFDLDGLSGFSIRFEVEDDRAVRAQIRQPNGVFTAERAPDGEER